MKNLLWIVIYVSSLLNVFSFRVLNTSSDKPENTTYFKPFDTGFVGKIDDAANFQRERVNEGAFEAPDQEILYEGPYPRQSCPQMVGPFTDGNYYCIAKEYGYCDRRSGTCFCNIGYEGIDCSSCQITHYRVGNLCYPKVLCPKECSGAGVCNYNNGTCACYSHRTGSACDIPLCLAFDSQCSRCTDIACTQCNPGYFLKPRNNASQKSYCSNCDYFDPRCSSCDSRGCRECIDLLLTSIHRSGYIFTDAQLPSEEIYRELSISIPFGSKSPEAFAEAESYHVVKSIFDEPLKNSSKVCHQGVNGTDEWTCWHANTSHKVCGHFGVFSFSYPNYRVPETYGYLRLSVRRTGGGHGQVSVRYQLRHYTTNDSDVVATAMYTSEQTLVFESGVIEKSFLVNILEDNIVENDEVFQIYLESPEGGASLGPQFRVNVTIVDVNLYELSPFATKLDVQTLKSRAGETFNLTVTSAIAYESERMTYGGENFFAVIENDQMIWDQYYQRNSRRSSCNISDQNNGKYVINCQGNVHEQGHYQLRVFHARKGGLTGSYYSDAFFQTLSLTRIDRQINFNWGKGRVSVKGSDYISIRWFGGLLPNQTGDYYFYFEADDLGRLWVDGDLLLDHQQEQGTFTQPARKKYLEENKFYEIIVEYVEITGSAFAKLYWGLSPTNLTVIPANNLFHFREISNSPAQVVILSSYTNPNQTQCYGKGLFSGMALMLSTFEICPRDSFSNLRNDDDILYLEEQDFTTDLYFQENNLVSLQYDGIGSEYLKPTLKFNPKTSCFDGEYTPYRSGVYKLYITYGYRLLNTSKSVLGSPFTVEILPNVAFGPYCDIFELSPSLYNTMEAQTCYNYTLVARDSARNRLLNGGDIFEVYIRQALDFENYQGVLVNNSYNSTIDNQSIDSLMFSSNNFTSPLFGISQKPHIQYGAVYDHLNGNYTIQICPVVSGVFQMFILLHGNGISDQPYSFINRKLSYEMPSGRGTYRGQYVASTPYILIIYHSKPSALYTTASGKGLEHSVVGLVSEFSVTIRDAVGNVVNTKSHYNIKTYIDQSPNASISILPYSNGTVLVSYVPQKSGYNDIHVLVDGNEIFNSPFRVFVEDGPESPKYSYGQGRGLISSTAGTSAYFEVIAYDLYGNRKTTTDDVFYFNISGSNNITGYLKSCVHIYSDKARDRYKERKELLDQVCNDDDGVYYGHYYPIESGACTINIYSVNNITGDTVFYEISNSPFRVFVYPSYAFASSTIVRGDIFDNIAGQVGILTVDVFDRFYNHLLEGGDRIRVILTNRQLSNVKYAATIVDNQNGRYLGFYNVTKSGDYMLSSYIAARGLVRCIYDSVHDYYGIDKGPRQYCTYLSNRATVVDDLSINVDDILSRNHSGNSMEYEYQTIVWTGLISPPSAEVYSITIQTDSESIVDFYLGPLLNETEISSDQVLPGLILQLNRSSKGIVKYLFQSMDLHKLVLVYSHGYDDPFISISLESPLTGNSDLSTLFRHWSLISTFMTSIHSSELSSKDSVAIGNSIRKARAGKHQQFLIQAKDRYENNLESGGHDPRVFAIGRKKSIIRGMVIDLGDGTYIVEYHPIHADEYLLYITIGCCPPPIDVGISSEISLSTMLYVSMAPFQLLVQADRVSPLNSFAVGNGLMNGISGQVCSFIIYLADAYDNLSSYPDEYEPIASIKFKRIYSGFEVLPALVSIDYSSSSRYIKVTYNMTQAGEYDLSVTIPSTDHDVSNYQAIRQSPFQVTIFPALPSAAHSYIISRSFNKARVNESIEFEVQLYDSFKNKIHHDSHNLFTKLTRINSGMAESNVSMYATCIYSNNGRYGCSYSSGISGQYLLHVKILNQSLYNYGGLGITTTFYSVPHSNESKYEIYNDIMPSVDLFIPDLKHRFQDKQDWFQYTQGISWRGYLLCPSSGDYRFTVDHTSIDDLTVHLDGVTVWNSSCDTYSDFTEVWISDSNEGSCLSKSLLLRENMTYELSVHATLRMLDDHTRPFKVRLLWKSNHDRHWRTIPQFYLYDSANDIVNSPISVAII